MSGTTLGPSLTYLPPCSYRHNGGYETWGPRGAADMSHGLTYLHTCTINGLIDKSSCRHNIVAKHLLIQIMDLVDKPYCRHYMVANRQTNNGFLQRRNEHFLISVSDTIRAAYKIQQNIHHVQRGMICQGTSRTAVTISGTPRAVPPIGKLQRADLGKLFHVL